MSRGGKKLFYSVVLLLWAFLAALPFLGFSYGVVWVFLLAVYFTLALSYDIVGGYLGYMNLGHASFFGLGAYTTAILLNQGFNLFSALPGAMLLAAAFAAVISYPLFRLRGAYFALATFGLVSLIEVLTNNLRDLTGGSGGISTPPGDHTLPSYYLVLAVAGGTMVLSQIIARSKFGLALFSIREDEEVAKAFGVPTTLYKGLALIISSVPASVVGGIYVWHMTYISPESVFGLEIALSPIIMAMLGGTGIMIGPLVGAVFITLVQEFLWTKVPYFHLAMYGTVLVLLGRFMPGGLVRIRWIRPFIQRLDLGEAVDYFRNVDAERMP
ncbi:amino acid or sugar ABC transport system, permease protein [delta proteobacterium NaphS2]|nr:amino acid or sugar ABC transport system, permease protein [delta proteobacterium NaphS2]